MTPGNRVGTVIDDKFRLDDKIGEGTMGAVYRGTQLMVDRSVAVKLLHASYAGHEKIQARFEVEARAIARLNHPNCITLYDFGYSDEMGAFYTVVEYIDGLSLEDLVGRPLPLPRVVELVKQTASALGHAHHHGIVHRDLKPENIMLAEMTDGSEMVKVLDFGIARIMQGPTDEETDDFEEDRLTRVGEVFGTPPYMSPEQSKSSRDLSPATDLYSLGIILYELLEGRLPFMADTPAQLMAMHRLEDPPPLERTGIPGGLKTLLFEMLSKDPEKRPESGDTIVERLDAIDDDKLKASPSGGATPAEGSRGVASTVITDPRQADDSRGGGTMLEAPPETDPVARANESPSSDNAHDSAVGEESELYELSDIVAPPPDEAPAPSDGADTSVHTATNDQPAAQPRTAKSTRILDDGDDPVDDPEVQQVAGRLAGHKKKMITGVVAAVLLAVGGVAVLIVEYGLLGAAQEDDMQQVAQRSPAASEPADEPDDDEQNTEHGADDDSASEPVRQVAVSGDDEDEDDENVDDPEDGETPAEDESRDDDSDQSDESDDEQPAGDASDEPSPDSSPGGQPADEPTAPRREHTADEPPQQDGPPRLEGPGDSADDEHDGPPRLDL